MNDTVSDALTRIKNSYMASKAEVVLPYSKLVLGICSLLERENFILKFKETEHVRNSNVKQILVELKYENRKPALTDVKRVSKPGLRIYKRKNALPFVMSGLGIAIISTPNGLMTDKQARRKGVGGEVMAYVW